MSVLCEAWPGPQELEGEPLPSVPFLPKQSYALKNAHRSNKTLMSVWLLLASDTAVWWF